MLQRADPDQAGELLYRWQKELQDRSVTETKNVVMSQLSQIDQVIDDKNAYSPHILITVNFSFTDTTEPRSSHHCAATKTSSRYRRRGN